MFAFDAFQPERHIVHRKELNIVRSLFSLSLIFVFGMSHVPIRSSAAEVDETLWEKFLKYDLLITDYDALKAEEQELCRFIFETEQSSDVTIRCERARRTLAGDTKIGDRLTLEQLEDCYGIWDRYGDMKDGKPWYLHCVPDIQYLDGWERYNEYWLDDQGISKVMYTGDIGGHGKQALEITALGVTDLSAYDVSSILRMESLDDGTYKVVYEQTVKATPYVNDFHGYENISSDRVLQQDGFTYYIMDDNTAALIHTPYTVAHYDTEMIETTVIIPDTINDYPVTVIATGAFRYAPVTEIVLPDSVTIIDPCAFDFCQYLRAVNIPQNLEYMGWSAFNSCGSLQKLVIDSPELKIPQDAFMTCGITEAFLNVKEIGESAFQGCTDLKTLHFGDSVAVIEANAFYNCRSLMHLELPASLRAIGVGAFTRSISAVTIPPSVEIIGALPKQRGEGATSGIDPPPATHPLTDIQPCAFRSDCVIYGYTGSAAQTYAEENDLLFLPLDTIAYMGDVNGDEKSSVADAVLLQKWLMGQDAAMTLWYAADYDRNGVLNATDLTLMKRALCTVM